MPNAQSLVLVPASAAATTATAASAAATTAAASAATATAVAATATPAASTEAAASAATAAAEATAVGLGTRFVDRQVTAVEVAAVQLLHRGLGFAVVGHFDKREPARLPAIAIAHDIDVVHLAKCCERLAESFLIGLETEIAHV